MTPVWTTRDKREIPITEMSDDHLLNTLRALEERRLLGPIDPFGIAETIEEAMWEDDLTSSINNSRERKRRWWVWKIKEEAARRGLI